MNQVQIIDNPEVSLAPVVVHLSGKTQADKLACVINKETTEGAIFALLGEKGKAQKMAAEVFGNGRNMEKIVRDISNQQYRSVIEWIAGVLVITIVSNGRNGYMNLPDRVEEAILAAKAKVELNPASKAAKTKVEYLTNVKERLVATMALGEAEFQKKKKEREEREAEEKMLAEAQRKLLAQATDEATDVIVKASQE